MKDLQKLYNSSFFDQKTRRLAEQVWFEIILHFCRKVRENLCELKKESFNIAVDTAGRRYVHQVVDELTKKLVRRS